MKNIRHLDALGSLVAISVTLSIAGIAQSQVVQLPTFRRFTVNTTVSVPDRGTAQLGGVTTARSGSTTNSVPILGRLPGLNRVFRNRGFGSESSVSRSFVKATIIDLEEMDQAVLARARAMRLEQLQRDGVARPDFGNPMVNEDADANAKLARAKFLTENVGHSSVQGDTRGAVSERIASHPEAGTKRSGMRTASQANRMDAPLILSGKKR